MDKKALTIVITPFLGIIIKELICRFNWIVGLLWGLFIKYPIVGKSAIGILVVWVSFIILYRMAIILLKWQNSDRGNDLSSKG